MKCLMKYQWVKLPRNHLPEGKGIMSAWAKLASRAAFRKGQASYCGHINAVSPGMWSGGVVGLKSILGSRSRAQSLETLSKLSELGYVRYSLNAKTKKLTYQITDWVLECSGEECMNGSVYATAGYGFLCLPRSITDRLVEQNYIFDEADAWLDLWCHTVSEDFGNAFSFLAPTVQIGKFGAVLTLETLGQRWNWEKTKVWRFFQKHGDAFMLHRLPGAFPECDAYVRVHAGTNIPVGSLANHELRSLRRTAHHYFDQLHLSGYMSKQDAYQWLADLIMAPLSEAHIGHLGEYYCKLVIEESRKLLDRSRRINQVPRFQVLRGGAAAS